MGNAVYFEPKNGKENIAQFEFIPYILSHCDSVLQARKKLENLNITNTQFSDKLPCAQLHWIISDRNKSLTVESTKDGLKVYDNPVGVLTNNPPFDIQMFMLNNYMSLSPKQPEKQLRQKVPSLPHTAVEWAQSDCRATFHPHPVLQKLRSQS